MSAIPMQWVKCHFFRTFLDISFQITNSEPISLVNTTSNCRTGDKPVCSTEGQTFPSLCHLVKAKTTLAYAGRCIDSCRKTPVCGMNGISYKSECEAWSGELTHKILITIVFFKNIFFSHRLFNRWLRWWMSRDWFINTHFGSTLCHCQVQGWLCHMQTRCTNNSTRCMLPCVRRRCTHNLLTKANWSSTIYVKGQKHRYAHLKRHLTRIG